MGLIDSLRRKIVGAPDKKAAIGTPLQRSAAALMAHVTIEDGSVDPREIQRMLQVLTETLDMTRDSAVALIEESIEQAKNAVDLFHAIQPVVATINHEERVQIVELLWEIVYSDGVLHDRENALMRRAAAMLYVSDAESGAARKRVMARAIGPT